MDSTAPKPARPWAARIARATFMVFATLLILFALYTWIVLSWSYSRGERAGFVQKFSKKGVISKTWEGELAMVAMPGSTPEKFFFTVRDDSVAALVNACMGKKVAVTYEEHIGVPTTFFGETGYFVTAVRVVE